MTNLSKFAKYLLVATLVLGSFSGESPVFADEIFSGGTGTPEDPFQITTCEDLQQIGAEEISYSWYRQMNDIDCSATEDWNEGEGFRPIGVNTPFVGVYDGDNHVISNLFIFAPESDAPVALFGVIGNSLIMNTHIDGGVIIGGNYAGGLVGISQQSIVGGSSVNNVVLLATYPSSGMFQAVGGLVAVAIEDIEFNGLVLPSIIKSSASTTISVDSAVDYQPSVGGLVGLVLGASVEDSYARGTIDGGYVVGGLAGVVVNGSFFEVNNNGRVSRSYADVDITGAEASVGGLAGVGSDDSTIEHVFSRSSISEISGEPFIGGLFGDLGTGDDESFNINEESMYFDVLAAGTDSCYQNGVYSGSDPESCVRVNTGEEGDSTDETYFYSETNPPLTAFDEDVWSFEEDALPTLKQSFRLEDVGFAIVISDIEVEVSVNTAQISWTTDQPSDTQVEYGTEPGVYAFETDTFDTEDTVLDHSVVLEGLQACTTYYYRTLSNAIPVSGISDEQEFTTTCAEKESNRRSGARRSSSPSVQTQASQAVSVQNVTPTITDTGSTQFEVRDYDMGTTGEDVQSLQAFLIAQAKGDAATRLSGVGATGYFGLLTQAALAEYQAAAGIQPALGYFGPRTRAFIQGAGVPVWWR